MSALSIKYENGELLLQHPCGGGLETDICLSINEMDAEAFLRETIFSLADMYGRDIIIDDTKIKIMSYCYGKSDMLVFSISKGDQSKKVEYSRTVSNKSYSEYISTILNSIVESRAAAAYRNDNFLKVDYKDGIILKHVTSGGTEESSDVYLEISPEDSFRLADQMNVMFQYGKKTYTICLGDYKVIMAVSEHEDESGRKFNILRFNICRVTEDSYLTDFVQLDYSGYAGSGDWLTGLNSMRNDIKTKIMKCLGKEHVE